MTQLQVILLYLFFSILWAIVITVLTLVIKKIIAFIKNKLNIENNNYISNKVSPEIDIHDQIKVIHTLRKFYQRDFEEFVTMIFELK